MAVNAMKIMIILAFILGLGSVQHLLAAEVKGLYEIEVVAQSQSAADRDKALQQAMQLVLARVLATPEVELDTVAQQALSNPQAYVRESQFALAETASSNNPARAMRVLFDELKLQNLLRKSQLGLWNEIRPETLVWLVVEEKGKRQFLNADKMPQIDNALKSAAKLQGLPLLFPLLDMQEQSLLSIAEVLSPYPHPLLDVSERYDVVSILVGLLVNKNGCWQSEWAHYFNQGIKQWQGECLNLNEAALAGMRGTYTQLAEYYAVKPDLLNLSSIKLKIAGIQGVNAIADVTRYLHTLPMIESVNWLNTIGEQQLFQLQYKGARNGLEQALLAGNRLLPQPGATGLDLQYLWLAKPR